MLEIEFYEAGRSTKPVSSTMLNKTNSWYDIVAYKILNKEKGYKYEWET